MATHSSVLGKFHGQRTAAGYSPWGLKKPDTTERVRARTHTHTPTSRGGGASLKSGTLFAFTLGSSKEMATHSSFLAWRIPGTEEPSGLPSMGSHRVGHD